MERLTVRRRRLASELKKCRELAGITQDAVARHFEWHAQKVTRIETARVGVTPRDVKDLLALYGVDDDEYRDALTAMARRSKERTWWTDYRDVMRGSFVGLEADAAAVRLWEPVVVPGILQIADYTHALLVAGRPDDEPGEIARRTELRQARQARLVDPEGPLFVTAVIDESVLYRVVGGRAVMRQQLLHLLEEGRRSNVAVQVLPLDAGEHYLISDAAVLLEFPDASDLDVVYLEGLAGDYYEEEPTELSRYRRLFDRLSATALNRAGTAELIRRVLRERFDE